MNLNKKKQLAIRTLGMGRDRIVFNPNRMDEVKEAITKQDIRDLVSSKAIIIKDRKGRKKKEGRLNRARAGSRKKIVINKKREYIIITRKLRRYLMFLRKKNLLVKEMHLKLLKEIKSRNVKSLVQMKERIEELKK